MCNSLGECIRCTGSNPVTGLCDECQTIYTHDSICECIAAQADNTTCSYGTCQAGYCTGCTVAADCPAPDPALDPTVTPMRVCTAERTCRPAECPPGRAWDGECLEPCTQVTCSAYDPNICFTGPCSGPCLDSVCVECTANSDCVEPCDVPTCNTGTHACEPGVHCTETCDAETQACNDCVFRNCSDPQACFMQAHPDGTACADGVCLDTRCVACIADGDCDGASERCISNTCAECVADDDCTRTGCRGECGSGGVCEFACGLGCVRGPDWWYEHAGWTERQIPAYLPMQIGNVAIATEHDLHTALEAAWRGISEADILAGVLLVASLNVRAGADPSPVADNLAAAQAALAGPFVTKPTVVGVLQAYSAGRRGVPMCDGVGDL